MDNHPRSSADKTRKKKTADAEKENVLVKIAYAMKCMVIERRDDPDPRVREKPVTHMLAHGARLGLTIVADGNDKPMWQLYVARLQKIPGDTEMKTFVRDFGVTMPFIQEEKTFTGKAGTYRAYRLTWTFQPPAAPAPAPAAETASAADETEDDDAQAELEWNKSLAETF